MVVNVLDDVIANHDVEGFILEGQGLRREETKVEVEVGTFVDDIDAAEAGDTRLEISGDGAGAGTDIQHASFGEINARADEELFDSRGLPPPAIRFQCCVRQLRAGCERVGHAATSVSSVPY